MATNNLAVVGQMAFPPLNVPFRQRSISRQSPFKPHTFDNALLSSPRVNEEEVQILRQRRAQSNNTLFQEMAEIMWERHKATCVESKVTNPIKALVSKSKKRFSWDGYDLDLAYITDNIISMGFPSEKLESIYRNSMEDVKRFLSEKHNAHYRVYNLYPFLQLRCSERKYDKDHFDGNVAEMPFEDHNAPPFELVYDFCADAEDWLSKDPKNIVVVHCKAGKGRTGLMVCCLLLYTEVVQTAAEALEYYAAMRTYNYKGVTIPSQKRYVEYFQSALKLQLTKLDYLSCIPTLIISKVRVSPIPKVDLFGGCTPWIQITNSGQQYKSKYGHELVTYKTEEYFDLNLKDRFQIKGDFKVEFFSKGAVLNKSEKFMHFWMNTEFVEGDQAKLRRKEIDGVKEGDRRFDEKLLILIQFQRK